MSLACTYYSDDIIPVSSGGVVVRHLRGDSGVVGSSQIFNLFWALTHFLTYSRFLSTFKTDITFF